MSKKKAPNPNAKCCVIYARYSSSRQREESIEQQVEVCTKWAEREGLEVVSVYADKHISGTTDARPQFQQMIQDAEFGFWTTVVVYKLDRFARDRYDAAIYRRKLHQNGVRIMSAQEQIPDSPEGVMLEAMLEGMNEYYSKNLSQNVKRGMYDNAGKCKANGVKLVGYTINKNGYYEINEPEARVIRGIFDRFARGMSKADVLAWAKEQGLKTRTGSHLNYNAMRGIVENEKYMGVYIFGDVRKVGGMPAIVDAGTWQQANERIRTMPRKYQFPLSGKLYDKETGEPYFGDGGTSCSGKRYLYYGINGVDGKRIRLPKQAVERTVAGVIENMFTKTEVVQQVAEAFVAGLTEKASHGIEKLENELAEVKSKEKNVIKAIEGGAATKNMIKRSRELEDERLALESQLKRARAAIPPISIVQEWLEELIPCSDNEELIRACVEKVTIDRSKGEVEIEIPWFANEPRDKSNYGVVLLSSVWWAVPNTKRTIAVNSWGLKIRARFKHS